MLLKKELISDEELQSAKEQLITSHRLALSTNQGLAQQATLDELYGLGFEHYRSYEKNIEEVTKEDIMAVASKYFDLNESVTLITTPPTKGTQ